MVQQNAPILGEQYTPPATAFDRPGTTADGLGRLEAAFAHHADGLGVFESGQNPIIVGQGAYNSAYYDAAAPATSKFRDLAPRDGYARIHDFSMTFNSLTKQTIDSRSPVVASAVPF